MGALGGDRGVHPARIDLQPVTLVGGQNGDGAFGGGAQLESTLQAVVIQQGAAEDGGELAGSVAAQQVHLPQTVSGCDVALHEDEVVHGVGVDVRDTASVAGNRDRRGETVDRERAIKLRQVLVHGAANELASGEERGGGEDDNQCAGQTEDAQFAARATANESIGRDFWRSVRCGQIFRLGVCVGAAFHLAREALVAQVGFAGIDR